MPDETPCRGKHAKPTSTADAPLQPTEERKVVYHYINENGEEIADEEPENVKKKHTGLKIVCIIVGVIAAVLLAVGVAVAVYTGGLGKTIALNEDLSGSLTVSESEAFYVLVIGADEWEGNNNNTRSDAMELVRVDPAGKVITVVTVPRDTPYQTSNGTIRLNEVYETGGAAGCIQAVSELTGVPISHYVQVQFEALEEAVNQLGGIWVDVPYAIDYQVYTFDEDPVHIDAGYQLIDGAQAVVMARARLTYHDQGIDIAQDAVRQKSIRAMMVSMLRNVFESSPLEIPGKVQAIAQMVKTDMAIDQLVNLASAFAAGGGVKVYTCTGPEEGDVSGRDDGRWLAYEAPEEWAALMAAVDAGEDPTNVLADSSTVKEGLSDSQTIETEGSEG
ncbi:MAG: LCP family protein [Coriobacteriia bacterium]|nr:LCP family protein [Coriobacteriia bacterium]